MAKPDKLPVPKRAPRGLTSIAASITTSNGGNDVDTIASAEQRKADAANAEEVLTNTAAFMPTPSASEPEIIDGIPPFLQVKNREPLTPELQASADARSAKAREDKEAKEAAAKEHDMATKAKKKTTKKTAAAKSGTKAKPAAKAAKPRKAGELRPGSKNAMVAELLRRAKGCTTADVLEATGWPSVSMPAMAKAAGIKLLKEKNGKVTTYRAG